MKTNYWKMVNGEKVYQTQKPYRGRNEDMIDYEMEQCLAGLTLTDNFDEDKYYSLKEVR